MEENKPLRVAQVIGQAAVGGVEAQIANFYRYLDKSQVQFDFLVENTSLLINREEIEKQGGRVFIIPSYKHLWQYQRALKKIFQQEQYQIVHSNMNALSVFSLRAAKKAHVPVRIAHSHSTSNPQEKKRNLLKNLLRPFSKKYATDYWACSEHAGRWLFGNKTFDAGKVTVINNAIDAARFKFDAAVRTAVRQELKLADKFVIGHVGRFMPQKNHRFLLEVFQKVAAVQPQAVLLLLGEGPLLNEMREYATALGVQDRVIFAGAQAAVQRYYQAMDCFVLPSLYEGFGIVVAEAQASGLPCVVADKVPQMVQVGGEVQFLPLEQTAVWVEALLKLAAQPVPARKVTIDPAFDLATVTKELENLYLRLATQKLKGAQG